MPDPPCEDMKMHRLHNKITTALLLALAVIFHISPVRADDQRLVLGTLPDGWPPFLIPAGGTPDCVGIMPDVLKEVCGKYDITIEIAACPEKRNRQLLINGGVDAYPLSRRWVDDPADYSWTAPVMSVDDIIVSRKDTPIAFTAPHDLAGLSIGVIHGYVYPTLDSLFKSGTIRKQTTFSTRNLLFMLARKRLDAIVTTRHVAEWVIANEPDLNAGDFEFCKTTVDSAPYSFAFTKTRDWRPFISRFNAELARMREDGRLDEILNKYR